VRAPLLALTLALAVGAVRAQAPASLGATMGPAFARVHTPLGTAPGLFSGPAFIAEARAAWGRVIVGVDYLGGRVSPVTTGPAARDLVEGRAFVGVTPWPWLALSVGPQARAYVTDSATVRWVFWQARARVQSPLAGSQLTTYVELWRALSSEVTPATPLGRAQGGEAGLVVHPPRGPLWLRLSYRLDNATVVAGGSEMVEAISLTVGVATRLGVGVVGHR
jgi:hypothetical protein